MSLSPVLASPVAILGDDYSHAEGPILQPSSDSHSPESQFQTSLSLPPLHPIFPAHSLEFSQVQQSFEPTRSFSYLFYHLSCFSLPPYILIFFLSSLNSKVNHRLIIIITTFPTLSTFLLLSSFCLLCAFTKTFFKSNSLHLLP